MNEILYCKHVDGRYCRNDEINRLRAEVEALRKCCTQRGARMQIMREWMREFPAYSQRYTTAWDEFAARNDALPWFDADGVPVEAALRGEGEK